MKCEYLVHFSFQGIPAGMLHTLRLCGVWSCLAVGLLIFTRGFLLARIHVPKFSSAERSYVPVNEMSRDGSSTSPSFSKAMVVVVDALRLDFLRARKYSIALPHGVHVESMQGILKAAAVLVCGMLQPTISSRMDPCMSFPLRLRQPSCTIQFCHAG